MDTSHISILKKFLKHDNEGKIIMEKIGDRYNILQPDIKFTDDDPSFSYGAIQQYLKILVFLNIIDHKFLIENDIQTAQKFVDEVAEKGIEIKQYVDFIDYLTKEFINITNNIKTVLQYDLNNDVRASFVKNLYIDSMSTIEFVLNFKSIYNEYTEKTVAEHFLNYELTTGNKIVERRASKLRSYIKAYKDVRLLIDFYEYIFDAALERDVKVVDELKAFVSAKDFDFGIYGHLGEILVNKILIEENTDTDTKVIWQSEIRSRSPYDFKIEEPESEKYIEVKTKTSYIPKISFQLSYNEWQIYDSHRDNYLLYYVDGIYRLDDFDKITDLKGSTKEFLRENQIEIKILKEKELNDLDYSNKGYWVSEK